MDYLHDADFVNESCHGDLLTFCFFLGQEGNKICFLIVTKKNWRKDLWLNCFIGERKTIHTWQKKLSKRI